MLSVYQYIVERSVAFEFDSNEYGRLARKIVEMLYERKEELPDDRIAILLNISTAETRRILQFLAKGSLVGVRKRTTEDYRTEYAWFVNDEVIRQALKARSQAVRDKLSRLLRALTESSYYICPTCYRRYTMEEAMSRGGVCTICSAQLDYVENVEEIRALTEAIRKLEEI